MDRDSAAAPDPLSSQPLLDGLGRHRRLLLVAFLLAECAFAGLAVAGGYLGLFEGVHALFGNANELDAAWRWTFHGDAAIFLVAYVGLQLLFIVGAGGVRLQSGSTPLWRRVLCLVAFAVPASALLVGLLFAGLEFGDRAGADGAQRPELFEVYAALLSGSWLWLLLALWAFWLLVGAVLIRNLDHPTGAGRLLALLLAGSWIEFLVALPIDLAARPRNGDCVCSTGSYVGLLLAVPALIWATGPALWLLYQRERRLDAASPGRARRILGAKSRGRAGDA